MNTKLDAAKNAKHLHGFVNHAQLNAMANGGRSEEKQFFFDKFCEYGQRIANMHKTYGQDGKGDDAIVHLHYFMGGMDWFITEKDSEDEQHQAFGLADLGMGGAELGYISLVEILQHGAELDLHWEPKTMREVKAQRR